jgi:hydroxymethylpyrimidine pyrophosphatase-like HAD family hydrolase
MFFARLTIDYDGMLARHDEPARQAPRDLRASGRKLLRMTGRDLLDLRRVFDARELFDLLAENGALLFDLAKDRGR